MRLAMPFLKNISPMKSSLIISIASPRFKIISKNLVSLKIPSCILKKCLYNENMN